MLRESKTEDDEKNKDLFRYVITSNGAIGDRCKRKEDIVQGSDQKKKMRFRSFPTAGKEKFGIAAHVRHRYFAQGKLFTSAGRIVYGKRCSGGLLREKHGRDSFKK